MSDNKATAKLKRAVSETGVVTDGALTVSFKNKGGANATVAGDILEPGDSVSFPELINRRYRTISYDASSTILLIAESR